MHHAPFSAGLSLGMRNLAREDRQALDSQTSPQPREHPTNSRNNGWCQIGIEEQPPTRQLRFVRLLALANLTFTIDDGGARSFSQLVTMGQIMHQLSYEKYQADSDKIMLPCEHFDLMGGSGTGGLIAIMLSRLRMSVKEVSDEFFKIEEEVYHSSKISPSERTQKLRGCMEDVMTRKGFPIDLKLTEQGNPGHCASFVLASPRTDAANKVYLRTYPMSSQPPSTITVVEAVLATCAVPPRFSSVTTGSGYNKREYIGASFGSTNPVRDVITEAHSLFGGDSSVASLLSLGTGHPGVITLPSGERADLYSFMHDMMNDSEQRAQEIERQIGRVGIYFRFSVEQGMQRDNLGSVADTGQIVAQTESYLAEHRTSEKISTFVQNFHTAIRPITLDQLQYAGGANISIQSAATLEATLAALESDREDAIIAKLKVGNLECGPQIAECMEGTRRVILEEISSWMVNFDAPNILWLTGHPGVGKSAVASSIVGQLGAAKRLGSRFFFQRQRAADMTTQALWRTVAYDLVRQYPTVRKHVVAALQEDETIPTTINIDMLFRRLIQEPLLAGGEITTERLPIVVIDALDECGGLDGQYTGARRGLMRTLATWSGLPGQFKLIVTSRGESDIELLFSKTSHQHVEIAAGQNVDAQSSEDIQKFLIFQLEQVALLYPKSLSPDWPGLHAIKQMADRAAGLFIWAETVVKFINTGQPKRRLSLVLEGSGTGGVAALYEQILSTSFRDMEKDEIRDLCSVVGTVILAKAPLSFSSLALLLSIDEATVEQICNGLQSVLESRGLLQFHHQSFVDFLVDPARSTSKFYVKREQETRTLTLACLRRMKDGLRFNICDFKSSHVRNTDVLDLASRINEHIPLYLSYSTRFWASHLAEITFEIEVFECVRYFMEHQFLFWLEVLSFIERVNLASSMLLMLINWIKSGHEDDVLARDMRKFVTGFASAISQSVPHIYMSALPFSPRNSAVSKQYRQQFTRTIGIQAGGLSSWPVIQNVLSGHTGAVDSVAFSPDGTRIASGSGDYTIRVWDAETGEVLAGPFAGHSYWVASVAFSPDGKRIASGSWDKTIRVWDAETGDAIAGAFEGHRAHVSSVAFSPDGTRIASGSGDKTIRVWDAETGEALALPFAGHGDSVTSISFSPDGKRIASGSTDRTIRVWDAEKGEVLAGPLKGHHSDVRSVAFSPDGNRIASGSYDKTIRVWNAETGEALAAPFKGHSVEVLSVAFSPDGRRIASGSDNTIRVWDATTGEVLAGPFAEHSRSVNSVSFSPDGNRIASGSSDYTIRVWDTDVGEVVIGLLEGHLAGVLSVAFSPDGKRIASGSWYNMFQVWDAETGEMLAGPFAGLGGLLDSIGFVNSFFAGLEDNKMEAWDAEMNESLAEPFGEHTILFKSIAWSPDGNRFATGVHNNIIRVCDAETGESLAGPFEGHSAEILSITFSPDGKFIASGSADNTIRVWDAEMGEVLAGPFGGHSGRVNSVAFSPDGKRIVSGSEDNTILVWDPKTNEILAGPFEGHSNSVHSAIFSPDGKRIASGSTDGTVRVWDAETGGVLAGPFAGHSSRVTCVAFSPDETLVVSGSHDKTIRVWDAITDDSRDKTHISPFFTDTSVMQDGWILGANSELLFWVPPSLRDGLFRPSNRSIIGNFTTTKLDLARFVHGESWSQCMG